MQIVKADGKYRVYGENIEVYDTFEPDFYQFMVDDNGPYVVRTTQPTITDKVYGNDQKKVEKCFKTYQKFSRSLGIMLVGDKGNGKTLFAKQMCMKMIEAGYPVINVTYYHPSLPTFMTQISQECVFLFDEFEKMFIDDDKRGSAQNEMLSTFDGINMTKKMFIITCNDIKNLSKYIYNRPGRFHYSFTFTEPNYQDIHAYLTDNLQLDSCTETVEDVSLFAYINGLNYDCLRSLTFELNNGYSLVESFDDLNIGYSEDKSGVASLIMDNGDILRGDFYFTPFADKVISCDIRPIRGWYSVAALRFKVSDFKYDSEHDLYINPENITIEWDNPAATDNQERKQAIMQYRSMTVKYMKVNIKLDYEKVNPLRRDWNNDVDTRAGMYFRGEEEDCGKEPCCNDENCYETKCSEESIATPSTGGIGFRP